MALRRSTRSLGAWLRQCSLAEPLQSSSPHASLALDAVGSMDVGVRYASNQAVKMRMKSVTNIQKITKAMKMVAASKMRAAQGLTEKSRGMVVPLTKILGDLPAADVATNVAVPITSDRGLCGGINGSTVKYCRALMKATDGGDKVSKLFVVGEKGRSLMSREEGDKFDHVVTDISKGRITYALASQVAEEVLKTEYDAARLIYNKFVSAIAYKATIATVLSPEAMEREMEAGATLDNYEVEGPDRAELLQDLGEFTLATVMYNALHENTCSELSSRMTAMESSTKNASEMLHKLTLTYNRTRQAAITTELIEIISGAAALEKKA